MEKCKQCCKYDPTGQTECNFCDFQEIYIERAKIDKAIEELQHIKVYDRTRTARLVSLPDVLDVFKRNIGE